MFDTGIESEMGKLYYLIFGFENNNVNNKKYEEGVFKTIDVTNCYCKIGSVLYHVDKNITNQGTNVYREAFKEMKKWRVASKTKD